MCSSGTVYSGFFTRKRQFVAACLPGVKQILNGFYRLKNCYSWWRNIRSSSCRKPSKSGFSTCSYSWSHAEKRRKGKNQHFRQVFGIWRISPLLTFLAFEFIFLPRSSWKWIAQIFADSTCVIYKSIMNLCFIYKTSIFPLLCQHNLSVMKSVQISYERLVGWLVYCVFLFFYYWQVIRLLRLAQIGSMDLVRRTRCFVWPVSMGSWRKRPSASRTKPLMSTATLCFTPTSSPAQVNGCWRWKMKQSLFLTVSGRS